MDESTRGVYEAHAGDWAELRPPRLTSEAVAFSQRCLPGRPIVDLGCGPGGYFAYLGRPLVGLDGARAMLALARSAAPDVALLQADLCGLPFAPRSLGGAWARASYLHLRRHDVPAALAQLHRALAPGAPLEMTMMVGTNEGPRPDDDFPGRFFAQWEPQRLAMVMHGAGLSGEAVEVRGDWLTARGWAARTLPDIVGPAMRVLVCGLNPSVVAADAGFGYAGATNRFWRAAVASGLIGVDRARRPLAMLACDRVGMTDLVKRATPRASELRPGDYRAGAARVASLVGWLAPAVVLFVGLAGYRAAVDGGAHPGWQRLPFAGAAAYVMPSTSGLNAATTMAELVEHMAAAASGPGA